MNNWDALGLEEALLEITRSYCQAFSAKVYAEESDATDVLMDAFGITPELKRENRQYWGRELGMCWQRLVTELFRATCKGFAPPLRLGADEPCDFIIDDAAVDTKYRVGSGDSGTLKKFVEYGGLLTERGYRPVLLFLRDDNLPAAIAACKRGGWDVLMKEESFEFIWSHTGYDLKEWLRTLSERGYCLIERSEA